MSDTAPRERLRKETPAERRVRRVSGLPVVCFVLAVLPCCADSGMNEEFEAVNGVALDAAPSPGPSTPGVVAAPDASGGSFEGPSSLAPDSGVGVVRGADAGAPAPDPFAPPRDASAPLDDPLGDLLDDVFAGAGDAGFTPPAAASGAWKLDDGSAPECPAEPPPIPIIGGPCIGIYFSCGWTDATGATYTCICDWVHWLCI